MGFWFGAPDRPKREVCGAKMSLFRAKRLVLQTDQLFSRSRPNQIGSVFYLWLKSVTKPDLNHLSTAIKSWYTQFMQTHYKLVILFGSRAKGHARARSDFDIAVLAGHALTLDERYEAQRLSASRLKISEDAVDVVDLWNAPPLLAYEIASHGKLLFGEPSDFLRFRVLAWKRYQDTSKFRRAREHSLAQSLYGS